MSLHKIFLIGGEDDEFGMLSTDTSESQCRITFAYRGKSLEANANDYFEALCAIRLELEKERLLPFCYGASLNVWPSGMGRDMGRGLKAYKMRVGEPATELVDIFSSAADVIPCYVSIQREFVEDWRVSIKG